MEGGILLIPVVILGGMAVIGILSGLFWVLVGLGSLLVALVKQFR